MEKLEFKVSAQLLNYPSGIIASITWQPVNIGLDGLCRHTEEVAIPRDYATAAAAVVALSPAAHEAIFAAIDKAFPGMYQL